MTEPGPAKESHSDLAGRVAVILAIGLSLALNIITIALLYAAIQRLGIDPDSGISDNGVQILLAWGGGIISVLAGYVGYIVGKKQVNGETPKPAVPPRPPDKA